MKRAEKTTTRMMTARFAVCLLTLIASFMMPVTQALASTILDAVQHLETGSSSTAYSTNTGNGAYGAFQQRMIALKDIGYVNSDGSWNATNSGAASLSDYLNCSTCQVAGETALLQKDWSYLQSNGTVSEYLGKTGADGNVYNESALLECAQQMGAAGCKEYISTGTCDLCSTNPHLAADIALASQSDSSAITGSNTLVDNSANTAGGTVSSGTALAQMETYCAPEVNQLMQEMGRQNINAATLMASNSGTGYSLMNGDGVIKASSSGGTPSYGINSDGLLSNVFGNVSCLKNMMSGLGLNAVFTPPNVSNLANTLEQQSCSALTSEVSTMIQPVSNTVGTINSAISGYGNMGFFPGMSVASLTGMNLNLGTGGGGVSGTVAGVGSSGYNFSSLMNNDSSWAQAITTPSGISNTAVRVYNGLFGSN
ncbi:hypothetical protein ACTVH1_18115 [Gluconobacter cerinus]